MVTTPDERTHASLLFNSVTSNNNHRWTMSKEQGPAPRICPYCKKPLEETWTVCPHCGNFCGMKVSQQSIPTKTCQACGATDDLAECPHCHRWYCKVHDLHECVPEFESNINGVGRPSNLWYLVPFFFGIIGGLIGYIVTKDDDRDMATNLLIFGIFVSLVSAFIAWLLIVG